MSLVTFVDDTDTNIDSEDVEYESLHEVVQKCSVNVVRASDDGQYPCYLLRASSAFTVLRKEHTVYKSSNFAIGQKVVYGFYFQMEIFNQLLIYCYSNEFGPIATVPTEVLCIFATQFILLMVVTFT